MTSIRRTSSRAHGAGTLVGASATLDKFHEASRDADLHSAALASASALAIR